MEIIGPAEFDSLMERFKRHRAAKLNENIEKMLETINGSISHWASINAHKPFYEYGSRRMVCGYAETSWLTVDELNTLTSLLTSAGWDFTLSNYEGGTITLYKPLPPRKKLFGVF